ncbi:hypothetical protein CANCADRAFT_130567 [Tortispora caseinolytica NRRL Y-17796]|uniref:tRNA-guanine(15) transglycosylase-like domain-containing protein n=1 Tax=Tortispora caseinolytica NRRL Y-17796 TaxID=767744 RepID=A0A1E4TAY7_9ASCO|nr:hypothetical protein CANCADRAFT_130567 [Tortispora caseinolytica NRRL Y-17796]
MDPKFEVLKTVPRAGARYSRTGRLTFQRSEFKTPCLFAPTVRGAIPHLTPDHVAVQPAHVAIEDYIGARGRPSDLLTKGEEQFSKKATALDPLRKSPVLLGLRRLQPVPPAQANSNTGVGIMTTEGFVRLEVPDFYKYAQNTDADVIFTPIDEPTASQDGIPGKTRSQKMVKRAIDWWDALPSTLRHKAVPPAVYGQGWWPQDHYLVSLNTDGYFGLQFATLKEARSRKRKADEGTPDLDENDNIDSLIDIEQIVNRAGANRKPLFYTGNDVHTPQSVLNLVQLGFDVIPNIAPVQASNSGSAFIFNFEKPSGKLAINLWEGFTTDMSGISPDCDCYSCKKIHRAYIQHLLQAGEMSAWVFLQIHNFHTWNKFIVDVQNSIEDETINAKIDEFVAVYGDQDAASKFLAEISMNAILPRETK